MATSFLWQLRDDRWLVFPAPDAGEGGLDFDIEAGDQFPGRGQPRCPLRSPPRWRAASPAWERDFEAF